jgi:hypothetical protein
MHFPMKTSFHIPFLIVNFKVPFAARDIVDTPRCFIPHPNKCFWCERDSYNTKGIP